MPLPVPVPPDVMVRNVALLAAVQEQVDAAVTGSVPVEVPPPTLIVAEPSVTEHDEDDVEPVEDGATSLFEHAVAKATAAETTETSSRR